MLSKAATIKGPPASTEEFLLTREYDTARHRYYHRNGYWVDEVAALECS